MAISLNHSQPARISDKFDSRVVPAASIWEPGEGLSLPLQGSGIRRLSREIRTERLLQSSAPASPGELGKSGSPLGESAQAYLAGAVFGLALVVGMVLGGDWEEPVPNTTLPGQQMSVSVR